MVIFKELMLILGINIIGELLSWLLHLPLPGAITGMLLLLILLMSGVLDEKHVKHVGDFLLQNMGFFFIPAGVSVMVSYHAFAGHIVQTLLVILLSTLFVMGVTGHVAQFFSRCRAGKEEENIERNN